MTWRHSAELMIPGTAGSSGEPAGWSTERFKSAREALQAGRARYGDDVPVWTAWVLEQPYAAQFPPVSQLLADAKERAAERGADVSSFDAVTDSDRRTLEDMLRKTLANWEAWLVAGPNGASKRSSVVIVENVERHVPKAA
jgi:hypothetical protein